jgi:aminotransferase
MLVNPGQKQAKPKDYIAKKVNGLAPSGIRRFFDLLASMDGVISLGIGEPDFPTPWHIRETAIDAIKKGYTMYTSNAGMPELRNELSRYLMSESKIDYGPEGELLITVGVSEALDLAMRAILDPGDEVIMTDPCYVAYDACVSLSGGIPVKVPTDEEHEFEVEASDIEVAITGKTKAILIGYPANPTGAVMSREKLWRIGEVARRHNVLVISDEIYSKLTYGAEQVCFASLPGMKESTLYLSGFSKAFAMTGWRVGFAAGPKDIIAAMTKIHQYTIMCVPIMSQIAACEALRSGEASSLEMVQDYNRRRRIMVSGLREIGLPCFEPKGAFYAFPNIKGTGMTSEEFAEKLLTEEKVAVVPGNAFGSCGEGYVRCCYATATDEITEALDRMSRFLSKHRKK